MTVLDMEKIISNLSKRRLLFYSEADFQFSLGWEIKELYKEQVKIYFEIPLNDQNNDRLDILVEYKNRKIPIELKYFHSDLAYKGYKLSKHNDSWRSYNFIKDIKRVEEYSKRNNRKDEQEGYALLISNEKKYWQKHKNQYIYSNFSLEHGRKINKFERLEWNQITSSTKIKGDSIILDNTYFFDWKHYSKINTNKKNEFRYLLCEIH